MTDAPAPPRPAIQAVRPSPRLGSRETVINGAVIRGVADRPLPKTNTTKHHLHGNPR